MADKLPELPSDLDARRCENCGLLAQLALATDEYVPATEEFRREAAVSWLHGTIRSMEHTHTEPLCSLSLRRFTIQKNTPPDWRAQWLRQLREDMSSCDSFIEWVPGLSIKDHKEMLDRKYMIEREDRRDDEMRKREDKRDDDARSRHWRDLWVLGFAIIVATIVGSMIQAGWIPQPW